MRTILIQLVREFFVQGHEKQKYRKVYSVFSFGCNAGKHVVPYVKIEQTEIGRDGNNCKDTRETAEIK